MKGGMDCQLESRTPAQGRRGKSRRKVLAISRKKQERKRDIRKGFNQSEKTCQRRAKEEGNICRNRLADGGTREERKGTTIKFLLEFKGKGSGVL